MENEKCFKRKIKINQISVGEKNINTDYSMLYNLHEDYAFKDEESWILNMLDVEADDIVEMIGREIRLHSDCNRVFDTSIKKYKEKEIFLLGDVVELVKLEWDIELIKNKLKELGFTDDEFYAMTPKEAFNIICNRGE